MPIFQQGQSLLLDRNLIKQSITVPNILIQIVIDNGNFDNKSLGCDLTHGYIDIHTENN